MQLHPSEPSPLAPHIMLSPASSSSTSTSSAPHCPRTPTRCLSSSSSAPGLLMGPFVLLPTVQTGQGSPQFQVAFPPGPSKSPVSSSLPESCSPPLLGGVRLHKSPTPGGNAAGSNPGGRSEARAEQRLPAWRATSTKRAWHRVSTAGTRGTLGPPCSPALPRVPPLCAWPFWHLTAGVGTTGSLFTGRSEGDGAVGAG